MPPGEPSFTALLDLLARIYPDADATRTVAGIAGMNLALVAFSNRAIDTWNSVLAEAERQACMSMLLSRVIKDYGKQPNAPEIIYNYSRANNMTQVQMDMS